MKKGLDFPLSFAIIITLSVPGSGQVHHLEKSPSWSRAHDWKSCRPLKGLEGSNPSFSARKNPVTATVAGFFVSQSGRRRHNAPKPRSPVLAPSARRPRCFHSHFRRCPLYKKAMAHSLESMLPFPVPSCIMESNHHIKVRSRPAEGSAFPGAPPFGSGTQQSRRARTAINALCSVFFSPCSIERSYGYV